MIFNATTHWHILGAGAIGCLWAGQLCQSQYPATLLVRPKRLTECNNPLKLTDQGICSELPVTIQSTIACDPITHLIIATKAGDTLAALQSIRTRLTDNATILLLQNGMGSQQQVAEECPECAIFAGSTTDGAWLAGFLDVHRAGCGQTWIGSLNKVAQRPSRKNSINLLTEIGSMDVRLTDNIMAKLQEKLAINSAINGVTALHQCPNGDLLLPQYQGMITRLCREAETILSADGYHSHTPLLETVNHVLTITAENYSSSLQDVRHKRKTELSWINGYLLERAEYHGITATTHRQLVNALEKQGIH